MAVEAGSVDHVAQVISQVVGPSFLLGAVVGFISILSARMNSVLERLRWVNGLPDEHAQHANLHRDMPRLRRRAALLNTAMSLAVAAGIAATILIIGSFVAALIAVQHVWIAAVLFVVSLSLLCGSLLLFAWEVSIGLTEHDHH